MKTVFYVSRGKIRAKTLSSKILLLKQPELAKIRRRKLTNWENNFVFVRYLTTENIDWSLVGVTCISNVLCFPTEHLQLMFPNGTAWTWPVALWSTLHISEVIYQAFNSYSKLIPCIQFLWKSHFWRFSQKKSTDFRKHTSIRRKKIAQKTWLSVIAMQAMSLLRNLIYNKNDEG